MGDHVFRIDDFDVVGQLDVASSDHTLSLLAYSQPYFPLVVKLQHDTLQVEQKIDDVFLHTVQRRVLMQHAADLDFCWCSSGHRRQENTPQRIAERMAVAALERFHHHLGMRGGVILDIDDTGLQ
jgi:hypothetical protein